jgi:transposase-like protein
MTQEDRDRLVALRKAKKGLITQREAAAEIGQSERHVRRLLVKLKEEGDHAVMHKLRGRLSNRRAEAKVKEAALEILSQDLYRGFGPTLASEYLGKKHDIAVSRETVRSWMIEAKLWRVHKQRIEKIHEWRPRRSRQGELVQWDTSEHAWLEKRGEKLYLISMIDDATSRIHARFVKHDSTEENMRLLWSYLEQHGRPLSFYTDKAALFQTAPKIARDRKAQPCQEQEPLLESRCRRNRRDACAEEWIVARGFPPGRARWYPPLARYGRRADRLEANALNPPSLHSAAGSSLNSPAGRPSFPARANQP